MLLLSLPARSAALQGILDQIVAVVGNLRLSVYSGPKPTTAAGAIDSSCVELARFSIAQPAFGAVNPSTATATVTTPPAPQSALATGQAAWFGLYTADSVRVVTGTVGIGSGFDLSVNTVAFVTGIPVTLTALTLRMPESC